MGNNKINETNNARLTKQEKVISLFKFIEELNKLKRKVVLDVKEHRWWRSIASFPADSENIKIYYRDRVEGGETEDSSDILLSVHKPEFQRCPAPNPIFKEWLEPGWDDYRKEAKVREFILRPLSEKDNAVRSLEQDQERINEEGKSYKELFQDNDGRINAYTAWLEKRKLWVEKQNLLEKTSKLFSELYNIQVDLERESETLELVAADGFILDKDNSTIHHPVLTRRVKIRYDAVKNTIYIEDTDVESELYTALFQEMKNINSEALNQLGSTIYQNDYHPLDRNDLPVFFKQLIHQISPNSLYSEQGIPEGWEKRERILLYRNPCYILRKRMDGALKAIEQIIENIEKTGEVPDHLGDIVEGGKLDVPESTGEPSVEEQLAAVGGESVDILLSKEANKEQLEIARRIERYNAVLVQGPPGTGKTHTIANLMGHFLAQGKSILVTSYTQKALSVLKEKLVPGLQNLCVSVLDDSNADMEKSIDGITEYMGANTSSEMESKIKTLKEDRQKIIDRLAEVRKKLFAMINQENNCIIYNGEEISPSDAAKYVQKNSEKLSYIPGSVKLYEPLPLSLSELTELYQSNGMISTQDEEEFTWDIPDPEELLNPGDFRQRCESLKSQFNQVREISVKNHWEIQYPEASNEIRIKGPFGELILEYRSKQSIGKLKKCASEFSEMAKWMCYCIADGGKGGTYKERWLRLVEQIQQTSDFAEKLVAEKFGKKVTILSTDPNFFDAVKKIQEKYSQGGKVGFLSRLLNKKLGIALEGATINGQKPQSAADCDLILHVLRIKEMRDQCASYWDDLIARYEVPKFYELAQDDPENVAVKYIPLIRRYLDWKQKEYQVLLKNMQDVGIPCDAVFHKDPLDNELQIVMKTVSALKDNIPGLCDILEAVGNITEIQYDLQKNQELLRAGRRVHSDVCGELLSAAMNHDAVKYEKAYETLRKTYSKISLQQKREKYLDKLALAAPQWADAIRDRKGMHGETVVPENIEGAWRWKQYNGIIDEIVAEPFPELQKESLALSQEYRTITAEYAEKKAWYYLLRRTECDISMRQALQGWKQTVKRIGKGTGKNAPQYRAKARKLMAKCQNAVPAWIMPIGKALESLNPRTNRFDVVIIDEASQADISSLAILYMGKKLIIVGDDKQVSPMAVGLPIEKINALKDMYISGKIPNAHLYDPKTSIYDIAATTFQPLMLREHFRCVPEIIEFSNWLSYDFKIKPLRDCSNSVLLPAVVNYRVENGKRIGKVNPNEAKAIVALMKACIEQPEYAGKTFGVISLVGDEQVKKLQEEIYRNIDVEVCSRRKILCGNPSNFQGDERDVIFLSVVDSAERKGPLALRGFGADDASRKRYNVASSRAKDQLWVVDSLDPATDLKPGDIRKMLIEFSLNPASIQMENDKIEKKAESPFESAVAKYLAVRGYHLVQQWEVGAYRLDMVVVYGRKKIAIECDGERYHSGEEKIRQDMERQTILERLGWRFIRIRGSEYYRNPEQTMKRVIAELTEKGIEPETVEFVQKMSGRDTELLQRVKKRAYELLHSGSGREEPEMDTLFAALDPKNDIIGKAVDNSRQQAVPKLLPKVREKTHTEFLKKKNLNPVEGGGSAHWAPKDNRMEVQIKEKSDINHEKNGKYFDSGTKGMEVEEGNLFDTGSVKADRQDLLAFLDASGVQYTDWKTDDGRLWMIGGQELFGVAEKAKSLGYMFRFQEKGSDATQHQPGWWTK